MNLRN